MSRRVVGYRYYCDDCGAEKPERELRFHGAVPNAAGDPLYHSCEDRETCIARQRERLAESRKRREGA